MDLDLHNVAHKQTWYCDGCSSWTDQPVTFEECLSEYAWVFEPAVGEGPAAELDRLYCPECQ